jgi:hypothetical protein
VDGVTYSPDVPLDDVDEAVLASLARALPRVDPVPTGLVERSQFAMTLAALEEEVAEVMSMASVATMAGAVRADSPPVEARTITFTHDSVTVMIALSPSDDGLVRVDGWLAPAAALVVELRQPGADLSTTADDDGRFAFPSVRRGPTSLLVRSAAGAPVTTPVVEL